MSGKGSDRRPALVTPEQAARNWERTFAKPALLVKLPKTTNKKRGKNAS